jgi:hypothetical protein
MLVITPWGKEVNTLMAEISFYGRERRCGWDKLDPVIAPTYTESLVPILFSRPSSPLGFYSTPE